MTISDLGMLILSVSLFILILPTLFALSFGIASKIAKKMGLKDY